MSRALLTLLAAVAVFVLLFASVPWFAWALGREALGDGDAFDRSMNASPIVRYFDWIEARHAA